MVMFLIRGDKECYVKYGRSFDQLGVVLQEGTLRLGEQNKLSCPNILKGRSSLLFVQELLTSSIHPALV